MPISLGGLALMPELMRLVFGPDYEQAVPVARWLIATGLWAFATVGSSVIYGFGDARVIFRWGLIAAFMLASGCYLFTPDYGAAGAGAVRWLVNGIMIAIGAYLLRYRYGQPFPGWSLAKTLVAALICAFSARIAANYGSSDLLGLLPSVATGAIAYLFSLRILNVITSDDVASIRGVINRLPRFLRPLPNFILGVIVTK